MTGEERLRAAQAAIATARLEGYGPSTLPADRGAVIVRLQAEHCTIEEISLLFDISHAYTGRIASEYRKANGIPSRRQKLPG